MNNKITVNPPSFQEQHNAAMERILFGLLLDLHARGVVDARSVLSNVELSEASAQASFQKPKNEVLEMTLKVLRNLLDKQEESR